MRSFRIALAQINTIVGDLQGNLEKVVHYTNLAKAQSADLIAFPEMAITGYPVEDLAYKPSFLKASKEKMRQAVYASSGIGLIVGFVDSNIHTYNAAAIAYDGKLIDIYYKIHLPTYGVFDEDRYFKRGSQYPVYKINGSNLAVNICEDVWHKDGPIVAQRKTGAELIININASPYHIGKQMEREEMIATRSIENNVFIAYVNAVGGQDELVFDGVSMVSNPKGQILVKGRQFEEDLITIDLDLESVSRFNADHPTTGIRAHESLDVNVNTKIFNVSSFIERSYPALETSRPAPNNTGLDQIYGALLTGTRDYIHKSGFSKVLIGLSGGIDSALTATIASDALGCENVIGVTMPSRYSSKGSVVDAEKLANNLGIKIWSVPIEAAHSAFDEMLVDFFSNTPVGVAEENVQSRIRSNILMTLSNKFGWLVLSTGNKSEMAMGYATLYGDMAGGFNVLKDVPKTMVYNLAYWRNKTNPVIPKTTLTKPPSAELKPSQKDVDTLPPYDILDQILVAYVEHNKDYEDIVNMGFDPSIVRTVITTIDQNEYKRRQAPPGVKITQRAFGKDWRLPIINHYSKNWSAIHKRPS
jgi:NAD+ synthase (glutamine-hydrolysing)